MKTHHAFFDRRSVGILLFGPAQVETRMTRNHRTREAAAIAL